MKAKVNEFGALFELHEDIKRNATPFIDLPRKQKNMTEENFVELVEQTVKSVVKKMSGYQTFYLDNFDIDDAIKVNGKENYEFVIDSFSEIDFIPVIGLDRTKGRNQIVFDKKRTGLIKSNSISLRLQSEDFEDFENVKDDVDEIMAQARDLFDCWILIIDNRVCLKIDVDRRSSELIRFIPECMEEFPFDRVVVTGSSIPGSIGEIIGTQKEGPHERNEILIYKKIIEKLPSEDIYVGDYTIVSPLYSDIDIPGEAMRNVTAPKIVYSFDGVHYIFRGSSLTSHPRGNKQYNDLAELLVAKSFYRKYPYS